MSYPVKTRPTVALRFRLALLLSAASPLLGCVAEGVEADCPEMPVTDDPLDPALAAWRKAAEEKGCVTPLGESIE